MEPISWWKPVPVTDCYDWTHPRLNGLVCSHRVCPFSEVCLQAGESRRAAGLTDGDAEAALELVLAVVEEGGEDQRERQREQLLL